MTEPIQATALIHHPYQAPEGFAAPQGPVYKASTVFFPNVAAMRQRRPMTAAVTVVTDDAAHARSIMDIVQQAQPDLLLSLALTSQTTANAGWLLDFELLRNAPSRIIGNSTFAWWAAWLGEYRHQGSHIFAPGRNVDPQHGVTAERRGEGPAASGPRNRARGRQPARRATQRVRTRAQAGRSVEPKAGSGRVRHAES